jgi:AraC-like DNA-binding protein
MQGWSVKDELVPKMQGEGVSPHRLKERRMLVKEHHITCPHCGGEVPVVNRLGRRPLNIGVKIIYDTLRQSCSVALAAEKLGCSRGYIYQELKKQGMTPKQVIQEK